VPVCHGGFAYTVLAPPPPASRLKLPFPYKQFVALAAARDRNCRSTPLPDVSDRGGKIAGVSRIPIGCFVSLIRELRAAHRNVVRRRAAPFTANPWLAGIPKFGLSQPAAHYRPRPPPR